MELNGYWFIDGIDIWSAFSMVLEEGSADFLKFPPRKASTEHDWKDSNGVQVDLSRFFFQKREGVLNFLMFAETEAEFWQKYESFIATMTQPGLRRLELKSHNNRSYYIHYQETNNWSQIKNLKGEWADTYKIIQKFSMVVVEPEPQVDSSNVYLVTEDNKFIIS